MAARPILSDIITYIIVKTAKTIVRMPLSLPTSTTNATILSSAIFKSDVGGRGLIFSLQAQPVASALKPAGFVPVLSPRAMSLSGAVALEDGILRSAAFTLIRGT